MPRAQDGTGLHPLARIGGDIKDGHLLLQPPALRIETVLFRGRCKTIGDAKWLPGEIQGRPEDMG